MARWALEGQGVRTSGFLGLGSQMKGEWRSKESGVQSQKVLCSCRLHH